MRHVVGEAQGAVERHVDPRLRDRLLAEYPLRLPGQEPRAADAVTAHVHQGAAVEIRDQADVGLVDEREAEARADCAEPPDPARLDELPRERSLRVVPVHERLRQHQSGRVGGVERLLDLCRSARVGLLAEHVLAGGERLHRPCVMHAVRQRDVHAVDPGVLEKRLVAPVGALEPVLGRVRLRLRAVAARDRGDVDAIGALRARRGSRR